MTNEAMLKLEVAVEKKITAYHEAHTQWVAALKLEMELEQGRHLIKRMAVMRLIGTLNAETNKAHSGSSAEKYAETDKEYYAYLKNCTNAVIDKNAKYALVKIAEYRVELGLALATQGV